MRWSCLCVTRGAWWEGSVGRKPEGGKHHEAGIGKRGPLDYSSTGLLYPKNPKCRREMRMTLREVQAGLAHSSLKYVSPRFRPLCQIRGEKDGDLGAIRTRDPFLRREVL